MKSARSGIDGAVLDEFPSWLTINDAATLTGFSPKTIRRWIHDGRIPAQRMGSRVIRIDKESLRNFINGSPTIGPESPALTAVSDPFTAIIDDDAMAIRVVLGEALLEHVDRHAALLSLSREAAIRSLIFAGVVAAMPIVDRHLA